MLAAVLWLGNVSFTVIDNENHVEAVADEGENLPVGNLVWDGVEIFCYPLSCFSFMKYIRTKTTKKKL